MAKNIGLFIDGTWNHPGGDNDTNVRKLFEDVEDHAGPGQVAHYLSGVGTETRQPREDAQWLQRAGIKRGLAMAPRALRNLLGGAFGWGTAFKIKEAYAFLCDKYVLDDRVFLFGFSRGAFAARSLAGFIETVGILYRHKLDLVERAYALYESPNDADREILQGYVRDMAGRTGPFVEGEFALPIYMIGVWDTVAALGISRREADLPGYWTEFHQTELPHNVTHARHALALHDLRSTFEPLLWHGCLPRQSLQQLWFPGAHADVGGGYASTHLSDGALQWMASEAKRLGLQLGWTAQVRRRPTGRGRVHHEIRGKFVLASPNVRARLIERPDNPAVLESFALHESALQRLWDAPSMDYGFWSPGVNEALRKVDEESLRLLVALSLMFAQPAIVTSNAQQKLTRVLTSGIEQWMQALDPADMTDAQRRIEHMLSGASSGAGNDTQALVRSVVLSLMFQGQSFVAGFARDAASAAMAKDRVLEVIAEAEAILDGQWDKGILTALQAISSHSRTVAQRLAHLQAQAALRQHLRRTKNRYRLDRKPDEG